MLWAGTSAAICQVSVGTLKDPKRSHKNVTLCFARVEKISQMPQKAVSQTSLSCLKSQDLSANRGCPLTGCAIYLLDEFNPNLTVTAKGKAKSESTVDKYASPDNIILSLAHLRLWKVPFWRQIGECCVSSTPSWEAEPKRSPDSSNIAVIFTWSQLWMENLRNAAGVQYGASGVLWTRLMISRNH